MATLTGTIKSLRKQQLKELDTVLDEIERRDPKLFTDAQNLDILSYYTARESLAANIESEVYSIAEITYAKRMVKRDTIVNKDKRF